MTSWHSRIKASAVILASPIILGSSLLVQDAKAGPFDFLETITDTFEAVNDTVDAVNDTVDAVTDYQERQAREEERQRRQAQLEAARQAATEREIQEAEERRQHFESLSPEQKQAYIEQQQAQREKEAAAQLLLLGLFTEFLINSSGESTSGGQPEYIRYPNTSTPTSRPAPAQRKPYNPSFYGDCHSPMGC
ncbi:MAG: DUF1682 domain-containing protein [Symploca sp. SIO1C2]|nr:DUF1682 domain-containing protein [Symploca sp. SIO1C2]